MTVTVGSRSPKESASYDQLAENTGVLAGMADLPAWVISCVMHVAFLFALWRITFPQIGEEPQQIIDSAIADDELLLDTFKFDATVEDQIGSDSQVNTLSPSRAAATEAGKDPQKELEREFEEELLSVQKPITDHVALPNQAEFVEAVDTTGTTEYTGGVEGSIDRMTYEIAGSLKERKTLVIWLFDASLSLKERREAIANRFENVYAQLGQLEVDADRALKTAVASYGAATHLLTEDPVDDVKDIVQAVRSIKPDETGKENVFAAVRTVTSKWKSYRTAMHRNVMLVIVTDERGDDFGLMEDVIREVRRLGIRVYCVGNAAPFGREQGFVSWKYEDGTSEDLPVDSGPETVRAERLKLGFWGASGQDLESMSSGFGPWAMTRLCAETGGLFLVSQESVRGPRFDPEIMREYVPDYRPLRLYDQALKTNQAKGQLVAAATATYSEKSRMPGLQLSFSAQNDTVLRQEITEAQKPPAVFDTQLQVMLNVLEQGEKDREKLNTPRWRASYDLAMGRVLALHARAYGYNVVLAEMKANPKTFEKKGSNRWRLIPAKDIAGGPTVRGVAKKAQAYLTRVVDEHPGTPWAMIAERELSAPLGWDWQEYQAAPPASMANGNNDDKARLELAEEEKKRQMQKKMAEKKRIKPKL